MRIEQHDDLAASYITQHLGIDIRGTPYCGLLIKSEAGGVVGCVVFNDFANGNIEMTGAGKGCWSVGVIRDLARYVFKKLGCRRVTARTAASNHAARAALRAMGFRQEGRMRDWYGNEDAIIYGLLRREQRLVK